MTVAELIQELEKVEDKNIPMMVEYDGGVEHVGLIEKALVTDPSDSISYFEDSCIYGPADQPCVVIWKG